MSNMKTITRKVYNHRTGTNVPVTMKIHRCSAISSHGKNAGKPCQQPAVYQVGNSWYCGFHHPDKAKRRLPPFALAAQNRMGRPRKNAIIPPVTTAEAIADNFAASFKELVAAQVKKSLRELLIKED